MVTEILNREPFIALVDSAFDEKTLDTLSQINIVNHSRIGHLHNTQKDEFRTSKTLHTGGRHEYLVFTEHIINRIYDEFGHKYTMLNAEPIQFTRYDVGEYFKPHRDFHNQNRNSRLVKQDRVATVILYITDGYKGGETYFPDLDITIYPKKGQMLYFTYAPSEPIEQCLLTLHEGKTVLEGTKIISTQWFLEDKDER